MKERYPSFFVGLQSPQKKKSNLKLFFLKISKLYLCLSRKKKGDLD